MKAVEHIDGPLLILAGAGSGKTRIITHRIAHLLDLGVPASEILAVTFTNKAAEEMRLRVKSLTEQSILACTFHSLGAKILRESIQFLGYKKDFTIYDEEDSRHLIKNCLNRLNIKEDKGGAKEMQMAISSAKNQLLSPHSVEATSYFEKAPQLFKEVYTLYQEGLKNYNALDFDDLLYLTVALFEQFPDVLKKYQKTWSFLLIDEYQDTNYAQYLITQKLALNHQNIFAVGDPDQSIYSWRGANINNILDFEKDYPRAKIITLEQNYRSTNHILKAANHVIDGNERRMEKQLWSELGDGEKVGIYIAENDYDETDFILKKLIKYLQEGFSLDQAVIFYRTNAQSRIFEDALLKSRIPYVIIGGLSFYQRREIKDLLALLRMILSDVDFLSFTRTINLPRRGIGPITLTKLRTISEKENIPILELCRKQLPTFSTKQQEGLKNYLETIDVLRRLYRENTPLNKILQEAIHTSRYLEYLKEDPETYEDRKENIEELISKAAEWEMENSRSLQGFLEELTLKSMHENPLASSLKLMTLHHGKGLEFDIVFIAGMEEDLFPHTNAKSSIEGIEEERRLCYVGMTRAKKHLYMTASKYRFLWGSPRPMQPSRFLSEVPNQHAFFYREFESTYEGEENFQIGMAVFHKDFGRGIVQKIYQTSFGLTYDVFFPESEMTRCLVAKYAKLSSC